MSVLFVCLGNICRSPTAEALFRDRCPDILCDSAGTSDWHVGEPPYRDMQRAARARGIEMSDLRARQFKAEDFVRFEHLVAMDTKNVAAMEALRPVGNDKPILLMARFDDPDADTVPDPYYTRDFDGTLDMLERAVEGLAQSMR